MLSGVVALRRRSPTMRGGSRCSMSTATLQQGDQQHPGRGAEPGAAAGQGRRGASRGAEARRRQLAEHATASSALRRSSAAVSAGFAVATIAGDRRHRRRRSRAITGGNFDALIDFLATQNEATDPGRAQPGRHVRRDGELPGRRRDPRDRAAGRHLTGTFSVTYKQRRHQPCLHADHRRRPHQPQGRARGRARSRPSARSACHLTPTSTVTVPAVQTRRASTTVELGSGQSFAIAGLLMRQERRTTSRRCRGSATCRCSARCSSPTPTSAHETELVIIITPYFVEPTSGRLQHADDRPRSADRCRPPGDAALQPSDAAAARCRSVASSMPDPLPASRSSRRNNNETRSPSLWLPRLPLAGLRRSHRRAGGQRCARETEPRRPDDGVQFRPGQRTARSVTGRPGAGAGGRAARPARRVRRRDRRHGRADRSRAALRIWRAASRGPARVG